MSIGSAGVDLRSQVQAFFQSGIDSIRTDRQQRLADFQKLAGDLKSNDITDAKAQVQAIGDLTNKIQTTRSSLQDVRSQVQDVHNDFVQRRAEYHALRGDLQKQDYAAAKIAFGELVNTTKGLATDLKSLVGAIAPPAGSSVNATA